MANPRGQQRDKPFRDALRLTIAEAEDNPRKLRKLAEALFDKAADGDIPAIKEIADRLDGKPAQAIIGGDEDDPAIQIESRDVSRALINAIPPEDLPKVRRVLEAWAAAQDKDEPK
jgi:hypothetical protein